MRFNISFATLDRSKTVEFFFKAAMVDMVRYFYLALKAAGHEVTIDNDVDSDAINIFFDRFQDMKVGREIISGGYKYGLICTEPVTQAGVFNPFEYSPDKSRAMYDEFAETAKAAQFVWCLLEEAVTGCSQLNPNSHMFHFRYVDGFAELGEPSRRGPVLTDYFLSGAPSPRRQAMTETLRSRGASVTFSSWFEPDYFRAVLMEQSRAMLAIQKSDGHAIFSVARIYNAIMNRVPFLIEYDGPRRSLSEYCTAVPPAQFVDECVKFARRSDLPVVAQHFYDAFRAGPHAGRAITELIDRSFTV